MSDLESQRYESGDGVSRRAGGFSGSAGGSDGSGGVLARAEARYRRRRAAGVQLDAVGEVFRPLPTPLSPGPRGDPELSFVQARDRVAERVRPRGRAGNFYARESCGPRPGVAEGFATARGRTRHLDMQRAAGEPAASDAFAGSAGNSFADSSPGLSGGRVSRSAFIPAAPLRAASFARPDADARSDWCQQQFAG